MKLKELLDIATNELSELTTLKNADFRLEQAEYLEDEKIWEIVVSFLVENTNKPNRPFAALAPEYEYHRIYKKIKIDNEKKVIGFYIFNNE